MTQNNPIYTDMHDDDIPVGRVLSRREVIKLLGISGSALFLGACFPQEPALPDVAVPSTPVLETAVSTAPPTSCVVRPELTGGPLFTEQDLARSDIRLDPSTGVMSAGAQLDLTFRISQIVNNSCAPLPQAQVDIWQCDANGVYSDTALLDMDSVGQKFLRGYQHTDENGVVRFTTIYPGWYEARAVHIHFKIRTDDGYEFNSQLFFDDDFTDQVFAQAPYNGRGDRFVRNEDESIFRAGGDQLILTVNSTDQGYTAEFDIALDMT